MPPALMFGFDWRDRGEHRRDGKTMSLWTPAPLSEVDLFSSAWRSLKSALDPIGFSWTSLIGEEGIQPRWWDAPKMPAFDAVELQARVDAAIEAEAVYRARKAALAKDRWTAEVADHSERAAVLRPALAEIVGAHPWRLGRQLAGAREPLTVAEELCGILVDGGGQAAR